MSWVAVTSPSAWRAAVSVPSPTSPVYVFGSAPGKRSRRVTRPSPTNSTPVAPGSSVPACPTRFCPKIPRHLATTSCDVHPAALSTTTSPSITTPTAVLALDVPEYGRDPPRERLGPHRNLGPDVGQDLGDGSRIGEAGGCPVAA